MSKTQKLEHFADYMCQDMQSHYAKMFENSQQMRILALTSGVVTIVLSFIILTPNHHMLVYPYRFIAYIGLAQASYFWYVLTRIEICPNGEFFVTLIQNTLVTKESYISQKLLNGKWMVDISG